MPGQNQVGRYNPIDPCRSSSAASRQMVLVRLIQSVNNRHHFPHHNHRLHLCVVVPVCPYPYRYNGRPREMPNGEEYLPEHREYYRLIRLLSRPKNYREFPCRRQSIQAQDYIWQTILAVSFGALMYNIARLFILFHNHLSI